MGFLIIGVIMLGLYWAGIEPVAHWSVWWIALPFALTVAWWSFADASGLTRQRANNQQLKRTAERRQRNLEALGLGHLNDGKAPRELKAARKVTAIDPFSDATAKQPPNADGR